MPFSTNILPTCSVHCGNIRGFARRATRARPVARRSHLVTAAIPVPIAAARPEVPNTNARFLLPRETCTLPSSMASRLWQYGRHYCHVRLSEEGCTTVSTQIFAWFGNSMSCRSCVIGLFRRMLDGKLEAMERRETCALDLDTYQINIQVSVDLYIYASKLDV